MCSSSGDILIQPSKESSLRDNKYDQYSQDILDPCKGFFLARNFLSGIATDQYRQECEYFLASGTKATKWPGYGRDRLNRDDMVDYVHPSKNGSNWRIYQFLHNPHSSTTTNLFSRALAIRDSVEECWSHDAAYRKYKSSLREYIQVTRYLEGQGMGRHSDFKGILRYPLLQCVVLLSSPGQDYLGGQLFLFTENNERIGATTDLNMKKGDAIFFDKSICSFLFNCS